MTEEEKRYIEHFRKLNESAGEPPAARSETTKLLRIIALLFFGAILVYLFTARIW
jgi:hypothetical protein